MKSVVITDKDAIRKVMSGYFDLYKQGSERFIIRIFTAEGGPAGHIYEGVKLVVRSTDSEGEISYTIANADSGYCKGIAALKLSMIKEVMVFLPLPNNAHLARQSPECAGSEGGNSNDQG